MDDYVEDYSYNNNFWMKSGVLYTHCKNKFIELMSIGKIFERLSKLSKEFSENIAKAIEITNRLDLEIEGENEKKNDKKKKIEVEQESFYIPLDKPDNSTRSQGIKALLGYFQRLSKSFNTFSESFNKISNAILDKQAGYSSKLEYEKKCDINLKTYKDSLKELESKKKLYYESINKAIEYHLSHLNKPGGKNREKNKENVAKRKNDYLAQVKVVESIRVEYIELQGHVFAIIEEFERNCTNDFKLYLKQFIEKINKIKEDLGFTESEIKQFEEMDGDKDNKAFSEQNKSLITGPKRNLFKEYSQDLGLYMENFEFLKKEASKKNPKDLKLFQKNISQEVSKFLNEIIIEEKNDINDKILEISKQLKENKLTEDNFNYLINKFETRFKQFLEWKGKNQVDSQNYKKVGEDYDDRFCYMQTFLGYFNKTRVANKCLDEENFNYFCKAVEKILELNMNEDIDYSLCDLVVILSSTFYMVDESKKSRKKYTYEVIRDCPIMQKHGFWVGLTKFELNQEIQQQKSENETLDEVNEPAERLNNSIVAKLMSISYNLMQFIKDSTVFNKVVYDIFKHCKINKDNRNMIVTMMEQQIQSENLTYITLDKDLILSDL
jgi:hypothetical protein